MTFVDEVLVRVQSGAGGTGVVSFRREKFIPRGGPDGGDGGRGGHVYLCADHNLSTLIDFRYNRAYCAPSGQRGRGKQCHGRFGADLEIFVPVGTVATDVGTGELIADFLVHGQKELVAQGGRGGIGNARFKSSINRAPRQSTPGGAGQLREMKLELKILADVGLVGCPNAGKSTFLQAVTAARPRVADYPFTTLSPQLGVAYVGYGSSFVIADIPGLVEGSASGIGLGHQFLKHITRTRVLVRLVDASGTDADMIQQYRMITQELRLYNEQLAQKPHWLAFNKVDMLHFDIDMQRFNQIVHACDYSGPVYFVATATGYGCQQLINDLSQYLLHNAVVLSAASRDT